MKLTDMGLDDELIIKHCIEYLACGMEIPLSLKVWLEERGLLYLIENPVKEFNIGTSDTETR